MGQATVYEFEWDPAKAFSNGRKHSVSFDQATTVFLDPLALTAYDASNSLHEERWLRLALMPAASSWQWLTRTKSSARSAHGCASSRRARRLNANAATMKKNRNR